MENQMIKENRYKLASDPTKTFVQPVAKESVPYLNFSALLNAVSQLEKSASTYSELVKLNPNPNTNLDKLNKLLYTAEQKLND
jgi:N-acetylated-alpha-linked acidic dipeptidase